MAKKPAAKTSKPKKKAAPRAPRELTPLQRLFVLEYLKDFNATQAAIRAGYSEKTASQIAYELLQNPLVLAQIEKEKAQRLDRLQVDADWMLKRLIYEAEADLAELYDDDGRLKPVNEWPEIWRKGLVAGIEVEELFEGRGEDREHVGTLRKVKLADRTKRLELIGRHVDVQAFTDKKKIEVDDPILDFMQKVTGKSIRPKREG